MASFQSKTAPVLHKHCTEPSFRYTRLDNGRIGMTRYGRSWRIEQEKTRTIKGERGLPLQCCSSSSTKDQRVLSQAGKPEQFGCLVNEYGWKVRRLVEEGREMRKVAEVQAQAFHVPVPIFNDLFFEYFQVWSSSLVLSSIFMASSPSHLGSPCCSISSLSVDQLSFSSCVMENTV